MSSNVFTKYLNPKRTPQSAPIPGSSQAANDAGGFAWTLDAWARLNRFLVLGTEGGTYYVAEGKLTRDNAAAVEACVREDGKRVVDAVLAVSEGGKAAKNDPALFALAMCVGLGDAETRAYALSVLPRAARIGTHLFHLVPFIELFANTGARSIRTALANWYNDRPLTDLAYQMVKYQQRDGWSHRDVLRIAHPRPASDGHDRLFRWAVKGDEDAEPMPSPEDAGGLALVAAFEAAKRATDQKEIVRLIRKFRLPREAVPTAFLTEPEVWEALLDAMPMTAMVRNLATMTRVGLLEPMSDATRKVVETVGDRERLRKARVHPLSLLVALKTYEEGRSARGSNSWTPVPQIVDALDAAFYAAFDNVEPTGQRWLLALDVSGSMSGPPIAGMPGITPRIGSAAMALVTAAVEAQHHLIGFTAGGEGAYKAGGLRWMPGGTSVSALSISPRQRLDDVVRYLESHGFGGTDCALPMLYARERKIPVDVFVIYTDSETWAGNVHPAQALQEYRDAMGIPARLVVCGMVANAFSIADPNDPGMMDVVGFSTDAPGVMSAFARGEL